MNKNCNEGVIHLEDIKKRDGYLENIRIKKFRNICKLLHRFV